MATNNNALPCAPACERNREPILRALLPYLEKPGVGPRKVLEVGAGTGQHAAHFCAYFSSEHAGPCCAAMRWQCSDVRENLGGIARWRAHSGAAGFLAPIELDLARRNWPNERFDFIYTANTLHIVSWPLVLAFCDCVQACLATEGKVFIYGPFNYRGEYTSASNAAFDQGLRARDPASGIRDFEAVCEVLQRAPGPDGVKITLHNDLAMPANNRLLVFAGSRSAD